MAIAPSIRHNNQARTCWVVSFMRLGRLVGRAWFYFRIGYSTYLTFLLGYASTLVTVYYLAIKNIPDLLGIFPKFVPFAAIATAIGLPLSVGVGYIHYKRSPAFTSEVDIQVEANPYYFKLPPGYNREVFGPLYLELLLLLKQLSATQKLLADEDKARIEELERKLRLLNAGGLVGKPRRMS
jgi:hypothetical protein